VATTHLPCQADVVRPDGKLPDNHLRLTITRVPQSQRVSKQSLQFNIVFESIGQDDTLLNLGIMLGNGISQIPTNVYLLLTDSSGKTRRLEVRGVGIAGRVDPLVVPLSGSSTYTIKADLQQYWSPKTKEFDLKIGTGKYRIAAEFAGDSKRIGNEDMINTDLMNMFKGKVRSNELIFEIKD